MIFSNVRLIVAFARYYSYLCMTQGTVLVSHINKNATSLNLTDGNFVNQGDLHFDYAFPCDLFNVSSK